MMDRRTRIIEASALFVCTSIGAYSLKRLPAAYFEQWNTLLLSLCLTLVLYFISNTLYYHRIVYLGALMFFPAATGESVIEWGIEYNYVTTEFVWSKLRRMGISRVTRYNLDAFRTTMSSFEILMLALAITTAYLVLDIVNIVKSQSAEMESRGGTREELDNLLSSQFNLHSKQIGKTALLTALIFTASNYMNSNIHRFTGFMSIISGFLGVLLLMRMLRGRMR